MRNKKECSMCKSKISGSYYKVQLQSTHDLGTESHVVCNTCANSLRYTLSGNIDPSKKPEPQIVMKSNNTLLTSTGYIKVIRSVMEGESLADVSRKYGVPIDVLRDALVPVYARMFDKARITDKELLAMRPVLPKKNKILEFKLSNGKKKDATKVQKLFDLGTWSASDICANVRWSENDFKEFVNYYKNTSTGFNVIRKHVIEMLDNKDESVELIARFLGTDVEFILDVVAGVDMAKIESVDISNHRTVLQLYQMKVNTKTIAGETGMPYRSALVIINRFRHPNLKEIK